MKNIEIKTKINTIIMLVGPTNCGKSFFANRVLVPALQEILKNRGLPDYRPNIQYLSSDSLRREVLGQPDLDKMDPIMSQASQAAFDLLRTRLKMAMSFPLNAEFIVLDTTALHGPFRDEVCKLAAEHNYYVDLVVFDYKDRKDYTRFIEPNQGAVKRLIHDHVDRLKNDFYKELNRRQYENFTRIKKPFGTDDSEGLEIEITNLDRYVSCFLPKGDYALVGDIHGCLVEFKQLLTEKLEFRIEGNRLIPSGGRKVVLIGDIINKGPYSLETVRFIHSNKEHFLLVQANHENYVVKHFEGKLKPESYFPGWEQYMTSIPEFEKDPEALEMLKELFASAKPFYWSPNFIATHAPCEDMYLGKMHHQAMRKMRISVSPKPRDFETKEAFQAARAQHFSYLQEGVYNFPLHVFGHEMVKSIYRHRHHLAIDTGCVFGGKLTAVTFQGGRPFYHSVPSQQPAGPDEIMPLFPEKEEASGSDLSLLEPKEKTRLKYMVQDGIAFVSGTMSPADKLGEDLESLTAGIQYFTDYGVERLHIQPKYMGSRATLYLHRLEGTSDVDVEKSFLVSRNGYRIKRAELQDDLKRIYRETWHKIAQERHRLLVVDGELLPWSALGKGLIEQEFKVVNAALQIELPLLKKFGFDTHLAATLSKQATLNVQELKGSASDTFKSLQNLKPVDLNQSIELAAIYSRQLELYGQEEPMRFAPFHLLKEINLDGTEKVYVDAIEGWEATNNQAESLTINPSAFDETARQKMEEFYNRKTVEEGFEGVVLKPAIVPNGCVPYLKVRNPQYLTIIYGYDYLTPNIYANLLQKKRVKSKMRTSIKEWRTGMELLKLPHNELKPENERYKKLLAEFILDEKSEKQLDPRL